MKKVIDVAHRFGITSNLPSFLPVAIGAADITLAEQVGAYSAFPNDGIRIEPHYIRRVSAPDGSPLEQKTPEVHEAVSLEIARQMMILLQAVTQHGTAAATASMKHAFGGKTGTTNNYTDAWFIGFSPSITCGTWIGFDDRQSLGEKETGAKAALPLWMDFMKAAIADKPDEQFSKANAPKKQLDVQAAPPGLEAPAAKPKSADDNGDNEDDTPKPAPAPAKPALPPNDALPNDESNLQDFVPKAKPIHLGNSAVPATAPPPKPATKPAPQQ
jgi:penicillin-binding protein 1A